MGDPLNPAAVMEFDRRYVKTIKEAAVVEGDGSFCAMATVWRGGGLIALLTQPEGAGEAITRMAAGAARCYQADYISVFTDAFCLRLEHVDEAEREQITDHFEHGSLQRRWDAGDRENISECLTVYFMARDGTINFANLPYVVEGRTITWSDETPITGVEKLEGRIPDGLRTAFGDPLHKVQEGLDLAAMALGLGTEPAAVRRDVVGTRIMLDAGCSLAYCSPEPHAERVRELVERYLNRGDQ